MSDDFVTAREAVGQLTIGLDTDWRVQLGYRALDALARIESRLCEVEEERAVAQRGYEHFMAERDRLRDILSLAYNMHGQDTGAAFPGSWTDQARHYFEGTSNE